MYPRLVWQGATLKSSQVYRVVALGSMKYLAEMYCGKDGMNNDRWESVGVDEDDAAETWRDIAFAMATHIDGIPKIAPIAPASIDKKLGQHTGPEAF